MGVIVDVDLISQAGFKEGLELSENPVLVGHSGAGAPSPKTGHPLLLDDQIGAVHEKGGLVGLHFYSRVLTAAEDGTVE